jgi:hypothetical protein
MVHYGNEDEEWRRAELRERKWEEVEEECGRRFKRERETETEERGATLSSGIQRSGPRGCDGEPAAATRSRSQLTAKKTNKIPFVLL